MDAITIERLRQILVSAATTKGYRDRFLAAGLLSHSPLNGFRLVADWQSAFLNLPPLDRATVRQNPGAFLASATDLVYRGMTSGTQGQPLIYFAGAAWNRARLTSRNESLAWWGITEEVPILNVASRLLPLRAGDGAMVGTLTPGFIHQLLYQLAVCPTAVRGYPSRLCEVAVQLRHTRLPPVVAVICTGECLYEQQRSLLEQVFCAPVVNEYGCPEAGISGLTCPEAGRLHLDGDRCLYEMVQGQLLTTDLFNRTMPLVRYVCGDALAIAPDPCPCGRLGVTATMLGRTDTVITTQSGNRPTGSVAMPALRDIQQYRVVQHTPSHLRVWVQSESDSPTLEELSLWVQDTFGEVTTQIAVESTPVLHSEAIAACEDSTWIQAVTQASWADWFKQPTMPTGAARGVAELWRELVTPQIMVNRGLSAIAQTQLQAMLDSPIQDGAVEWIKVRMLLFACSFLADDPAHANAVYEQAIARLELLLHHTNLSAEQQFLLSIERLIPSLYLPNGTTLWSHDVGCGKLDRFAIYHLLQALEAAAQRAIAQGHIPNLRPLLSVLIGELNDFAAHFGGWLLAHWVEWLQGEAIACEVSPPDDEFARAWLVWRQVLQVDPSRAKWTTLAETARSPQTQSRAALERGYQHLLLHHTLDPTEWLAIGRTHGAMGRADGSVNPMAWAPILKALAVSLMASDQRELAYQCLVAATVPSSRVSAFERSAATANSKQAILAG